jgi:hypothetical protein
MNAKLILSLILIGIVFLFVTQNTTFVNIRFFI